MDRRDRWHPVGRAAAIDQTAPPVRARRYLGFLLPRPPGAGGGLRAMGGRRPLCPLLARMAEIGIPRRRPWSPTDWPCGRPLHRGISSSRWRGVLWLGGGPWRRLTNKPEAHCLHLWKSKRLSRISTAAKAISSTLWTASKRSCRLRAIQSERPRKPLHRVALCAGWGRLEGRCRFCTPRPPHANICRVSKKRGRVLGRPATAASCREPVGKHTGFLSSGGSGRLPITRPTRGADPRFFRWLRGREMTRDFWGPGAALASGPRPDVNHGVRSTFAAASFYRGVGGLGGLSSAAGRPIGKVGPVERREWWPCLNA